MDVYSKYESLSQPGSFDPEAHQFLKEHGLLHVSRFAGVLSGHEVDLHQWVEDYPQDDGDLVIVWCGEVTITPAAN